MIIRRSLTIFYNVWDKMVHKFLFKTFFGALLWYTASLPPFQIQIKSTLRFRFHSRKVRKVKLFWQHRKNLTHQLLLIYYSLLFSLAANEVYGREKINYKFIIIRCFVLEINCLPLSLMPSRCFLSQQR